MYGCTCMPSVFIVANTVSFTNLGQEAYAADIRVTSVQMTSINFKATNLEPATEYLVSVAAVTKEGIKHHSPSVQVTTLPRGACVHVCACLWA